jgi:RHH-type proline utilization regulon transcriptional repressor/proline dehydrogenase/delta 1-pyrroline-5-carboxylate dehydrogenase
MIVDSTALPEAAVRDIVNSAFQSAGQRCSALRVLFVQADIGDRLLEMLEGAAMELRVSDPWEPATDVGPVIDEEARSAIVSHCDAFSGRVMFRHPMKDAGPRGRFVAPAAIRLDRFDELEREIFGPVLHVLEFEAAHLDTVVDRINDSRYGLTFGVHSRLDDRVQAICQRARVGNLYVNRNQIGAVVGVQPFGGEGLSGTGPKAGGPHYLSRFTREPQAAVAASAHMPGMQGGAAHAPPADPQVFADAVSRAREAWDARSDREAVLATAARKLPAGAGECARQAVEDAAPLFAPADALPGPTGERNHLTLHGRGIALCLGDGDARGPALVRQAFVALAAGNPVALAHGALGTAVLAALREAGLDRTLAAAVDAADPVALAAGFPELALLAWDGAEERVPALRVALAERPGRRVLLLSARDDVELFATERVVSIDTTASGGNATLLTLDEV